MQNVIYLKMTNFDPKTVALRVWDLETSFWQFMFKNLIKPQVHNPSFNFYKGDFILCRFIR